MTERLPVSPLVMRALEVAEKRLGTAALSQRLGTSESTLKGWQLGHAAMPEQTFLELVDLLTELSVSWEEWNPAG
jgi:hypothetical protein